MQYDTVRYQLMQYNTFRKSARVHTCAQVGPGCPYHAHCDLKPYLYVPLRAAHNPTYTYASARVYVAMLGVIRRVLVHTHSTFYIGALSMP